MKHEVKTYFQKDRRGDGKPWYDYFLQLLFSTVLPVGAALMAVTAPSRVWTAVFMAFFLFFALLQFEVRSL